VCWQIHGNVCMAAVVVTEQLDWRLHGFDLLSEHAGGGFDWPLMASSWMVRFCNRRISRRGNIKTYMCPVTSDPEAVRPQVGAQYKTGEVAKSEWQTVQQSPPWAVDAWGLGCLMQEAFTGRTLTRTEELRNTESIPQAVLQVTSRTARLCNRAGGNLAVYA